MVLAQLAPPLSNFLHMIRLMYTIHYHAMITEGTVTKIRYLSHDLEGSYVRLNVCQQLQGTLLVTLRNSASGLPLDDGEVRRKFQQFGDVKSVRPAGDRTE
jgi:hypothetical protein